MKRIHVAAAVLNQTPLDWEGNRDRIIAALDGARKAGATLVCLPELSIPGYSCEDAFLGAGIARRSMEMLEALLPATKGIVASFGIPVLYRNGLFNCAALAVDGELIGFVAKHHLAGDGVYYEPRWFKAWPDNVSGTIDALGRTLPIGDVVFEVGGVRIGFEICEDAWVANRPGAHLAALGVDVILNPSASHFAFDKIDIRRRFVLEGSRAFSTSYVYANHVGNDAGRIVWDGGAMIASGGRMIAEGPRLGFEDWGVTSAVIDVEATRMTQARTGSFRPDLANTVRTVKADFAWPKQVASVPTAQPEAWEESPFRKEEEFTRAVTLALFDYMRRSYSRGFVVSLSGGADSTAVVSLVALMAKRALAQLGPERLKQKLAYMRDFDPANAMRSLLLTVYQGTQNSSQTTHDAARTVAEGIGCEHHAITIDELVADYIAVASKALGRQLTWETDDLALQNIQARVRGPSVWMLANVRSALLLATSNRSEAAVGYSTMDGDTCGGLSPIAGIDKAFLRHWLGWLLERGPDGFGPLPFLRAVVEQRSTPELRPVASKQVSEGDLMPFPVLDAIERAAIRDKREPADVLTVVSELFPQIAKADMAAYVERFFTLWARNQWKRERYAPSFHLDDENLDPKTWCRFPILSAGFNVELGEMHRTVKP